MIVRGNIITIWSIVGATLVCLVSTITEAAGPKSIGIFKDWSANLLIEGKAKICYLHGAPGKSAGKYTKRGDTYLQVTHRTKPKTRNEVSVTAGYSYKKGSQTTVTIDGKKFVLFTQGDTAWAGDENPDALLVAAMRAGRVMVVRGTSSRGTATTDSYSLAGFTAAHKAISKACGVK